MPTNSVSATSAAYASGWSIQGRAGGFFAEKPVYGGKLISCAALSADLVVGIQEIENIHGRLGNNSPQSPNFKGNNNS